MLPFTFLKTIVLLGGLITITSVQSNDLVLVVNKNNPNVSLSRSQLVDLYMGKYVAFPDGSKAVPVDIQSDNQIRQQFYQALVGMPLARVNAYWSKVKFSGRARPPTEQKNEQAILDFVAETENAIAYVQRSSVTDRVKVVYRFDE